MHHYNK